MTFGKKPRKTRKSKAPLKLQTYFRRKSDVDLIRRAASLTDKLISQFNREAILKEARRVIAEHNQQE